MRGQIISSFVLVTFAATALAAPLQVRRHDLNVRDPLTDMRADFSWKDY